MKRRFLLFFAFAIVGVFLWSCADQQEDATVRGASSARSSARNTTANAPDSAQKLTSTANPRGSEAFMSGLSPNKLVTQYLYDAWTEENGLTQGAPNVIAQTPDGYLWLGTVYGLVRFDGVRFVALTEKNTPVLKSNDIRALCVDRNGGLWIGTYGGGLVRLFNGNFTRHIADTSQYNAVTAIHQDNRGNLWVGTTVGLLFGDSILSKHRTITAVEGEEITAIVEDIEGRAWVGTTQKGLYCLSGAAQELHEQYDVGQGLPESLIRSLAVDANGVVWAGTNSGAAHFNPVTKRFAAFTTNNGLSSNAVTTLFIDRHQTLWIGTNNAGLNRVIGGSVDVITTAGKLSGNVILSLFEDREGSLWVGAGSGLDRIKDPKFTVWGKPEGFAADIFSVVYQDSKGSIWTGSYFQSGITRLTYKANDKTLKKPIIQHFDTAQGLNGVLVTSICEDSEGRMWFGTLGGGGLLRYERGAFTSFYGEDIAHQNIRAIYEDKKRRLWLGSYGAGLNTLAGSAIASVYTTANGLSSDYILGIVEEDNGYLWLATARGSGPLTIVKPDSGVVRAYTADTSGYGIPNKNAHFVVRDKQGTIWVGTPTGLALYRNGRFYNLSTKNGLPDDAVFCLVQDENNDYWISCNAGIMRLEKSQVDAFVAGEVQNVSVRLFGKSDGMRSIEFKAVGQPMGYATNDGSIWFPTVKGLVSFVPKKLRFNTLAPTVLIEGIISNDKPVNLNSRNEDGIVEVPAGTDRITLRYTALSLLFPENVTIKHRLDEFDEDWVTDNDQRRAYDYTSLAPGRYVFRVRAANNDGRWNDNETAIEFYVAPKFYQTYPFYGLCLLGAAGIVAGVFRWRLRQLQDRERELANLVNERTREIRRQVKILDEQAREIEIANDELKEKNQLIEEERIKSEQLLLNILPPSIANRLKSGERIIADKFDSVTVMFADIVGFTNLSSRVSPEHLVENLSMIFTLFDDLAAKYNLEKIKTIGDAYMVVGGLPEPRPKHTASVARMALELQRSITDLMQNMDDPISVRVGIHTGPVVAGVIGVQKFAYDLWGDSVNTASRMESSGEPEKIHCTEDVYQILKEHFVFQQRGEIVVKGKGLMKTYFLLAER